MSNGKAFAVDVPITDLDENIDDFHLEEVDNNNHDDNHDDNDNDNVSIDLRNLDFGSNRPNIFQRGLSTISNLLKPNNKNKYISRNGDYSDDIELINQNIDNDSNEFYNFDNDNYNSFQFKNRNKCLRFLNALSHSKLFIYLLLFIVIILLVVLIVLISHFKKTSNKTSNDFLLNSNLISTTTTTIVLAIDGLHPHFISFNKMPFLTNLLNSSNTVFTPFMIPNNPSSKLTNLWSISTGLYPAENGIIGDSFFDVELNEEFSIKNDDDDKKSKNFRNSKWWLGEPIWETALKNNLNVASFNWPGVNLIDDDDKNKNKNKNEQKLKPNLIKSFKGSEELNKELKEFEKIFSKKFKNKNKNKNKSKKSKNNQIPSLILSYISRLSHVIKDHGISGKKFENELLEVDNFISSIYQLLTNLNILDQTNLLILSDGGYIPIGSSKTSGRILYLDELIDMNKIEHIEGFPIIGINPIIEFSIEELVDEMKDKLNNHKLKDYFEIFEVNDEISKLIYGGIEINRISPILIIPKAGYTIRTKNKINKLEDDCDDYINGFKNDEVLSRSVFIGTGPIFTNFNTNNNNNDISNILKPFNNVEVYNIISQCLNITNDSILNEKNLINSNWKDAKTYPGVEFNISIIDELSFIEEKFGFEEELIIIDPISEEVDSDKEETEKEMGQDNDSDVSNPVDNITEIEPISVEVDTSKEEAEKAKEEAGYDDIDNITDETDQDYENYEDNGGYDDFNDESNEVQLPDEGQSSNHHNFWDKITESLEDLVDDLEDMLKHSNEKED